MGKTAAIVSLVLMTIGCVGGENGIASDKRAPELDAVAASTLIAEQSVAGRELLA